MTYTSNITPLLGKQLILELQPNQLITMTRLTTNLTPKYKSFTSRLILLFSTRNRLDSLFLRPLHRRRTSFEFNNYTCTTTWIPWRSPDRVEKTIGLSVENCNDGCASPTIDSDSKFAAHGENSKPKIPDATDEIEVLCAPAKGCSAKSTADSASPTPVDVLRGCAQRPAIAPPPTPSRHSSYMLLHLLVSCKAAATANSRSAGMTRRRRLKQCCRHDASGGSRDRSATESGMETVVVP
jgi:hypothetical protein